MGVGPYEFFNLYFPLIFVPLLPYATLAFVFAVRRLRCNVGQEHTLRATPLFWATALLCFVGVLPRAISDKVLVFRNNPSESLIFATILSLAAASVALSFYEQAFVKGALSRRSCVVGLLLILPAITSVCAFVKISNAYVVLGITCYVFARAPKLWHRLPLLYLLIVVLACLASVYFVVGHDRSVWRPWEVFSQVSGAWLLPFLLLHFFWTWAIMAVQLRQLRIRDLAGLRQALEGYRLFPAEIAVAGTAVSVLPGLAIRLPWSVWWFFTRFAQHLEMCIFLALIPWSLPERWRARWTALPSLSFTRVTTFLGLAVLSLLVLVSVAEVNRSQVGVEVRVRAKLLGVTPPEVREGPLPFLRLYRASPLVGPLPQQVVRNRNLLGTLDGLSSWPTKKKRESLVYVPRRCRSLWSVSPFPDVSLSFLVPAISGMAMIDGLPDLTKTNPEFRNSHGFPAYGFANKHSSTAASEDLDRANALRRAARMGFRRVVLIDADTEGRLTIKELTL